MLTRIQLPPVKAVLLPALYCALAGGLSEFLNTDRFSGEIGWYVAPTLFSIAVMISLRKTGRITVIRAIMLLLVQFGIFNGAIWLALSSDRLPPGCPGWVIHLWNWLAWTIPGMAAMLAIALLLRIRIRTHNVLVGGICSLLACILSFAMAPSDSFFFDPGPIFIVWQAVMGLAVGLLNVQPATPVMA